MGLIIAADVHSASVQDRDGALNLFTQAKYKAPTLRKFFADQGYIAKPLFIGDRIRLPRKLLMLQVFRQSGPQFSTAGYQEAHRLQMGHTVC